MRHPRNDRPGRALPAALADHRRLLAVVAHPDDESFGLGAILSAFTSSGRFAAVLCFTHGEGSTLGERDSDLNSVRARELEEAAKELGIERVRLLDYPDGQLAAVPMHTLRDNVMTAIDEVNADVLLVFGRGGVTGHPDHVRATEAAVAAARDAGLQVVAWTLPERVVRTLNREFGTMFEARCDTDILEPLIVDRKPQLRAVARHRTQSVHNPVLWRRLELQGHEEWLRRLEVPVA